MPEPHLDELMVNQIVDLFEKKEFKQGFRHAVSLNVGGKSLYFKREEGLAQVEEGN